MKSTKNIFRLEKDTFKLYYNIFLSYFFKGSSLLLSVLLTPLYINYFNNQVVLGGWFTVLSILNWIMYFDFGIGNGLRNKLSNSLYTRNYKEAKVLISSTYFVMFIIVLIVLVLGITGIFFIDLNELFGISKNIIPNNTLKLAVVILFIGMTISFYFNISTGVMHTIQMSGLTGLFSLITNIALLIFIVFSNTVKIESKFLELSIVFAVSASLPLIIATILIFSKKLKSFAPRLKYYNSIVAKDMMKSGLVFFLIQLGLLIINSTDQILITQLFGANYVVNYQLYHKIYYMIVTMFSLVSNPLWGSISKSKVERNYSWIKAIKRKVYIFALLFSLFTVVIVFLNQFIFNIWLGDNTIKVEYLFAIAFAIYSVIMVWLFAVTAISNGLNYLKVQLVFSLIGMFIKIPIVLVLSMIIDSWLIILISNILIMGLNLLFNLIFLEKKLKNMIIYHENERGI